MMDIQPPLTPQEQWGVPPGFNTIRFLVKHICHNWVNLTKDLA